VLIVLAVYDDADVILTDLLSDEDVDLTLCARPAALQFDIV